MLIPHADYEIDDNPNRLDFQRIYEYLSTTYWWKYGLTPDLVEKGARNSSLVIGVYKDNQQIAYARAVSDKIRFAWLADVYVHPDHRRRGIAKAMVRFALEHPEHKEVTKWMLATKDAQGVYAALGFGPPPDPTQILQLTRER